MKPEPMNKADLLEVKADLLCMGLHPSEVSKRMYSRQNPCHDQKTGNVGIHLCLSNGSHVLVTVHHSFDRKSPYELRNDGEHLVLARDETIVDEVTEVPMPSWYQKYTRKVNRMASLFLHEGSTFMHQAYSGCDYQLNDKPCQFCAASRQWKVADPFEVAEVVDMAYEENPDYQVCLGGGTRLPLERNMLYFLEEIREIRRRNTQIPVWLETIPPAPDEVSALVQAGATSFGFNIEIWNDARRKEVCPGKSEIPKSRYIEAMKTAVSLLGPNRVGSCLIVGLEAPESTAEGAEVLASLGVQPCLLPFKPWDKSEYAGKRASDTHTLLTVSRAGVKSMRAHGLSPRKNQGCLKCEACTIDHDIYDLNYPKEEK